MTAEQRYLVAPEVAPVDRVEELEAAMRAHMPQCRMCRTTNFPCPYGENLLLAILEAA